jgi:hypothetical protein
MELLKVMYSIGNIMMQGFERTIVQKRTIGKSLDRQPKWQRLSLFLNPIVKKRVKQFIWLPTGEQTMPLRFHDFKHQPCRSYTAIAWLAFISGCRQETLAQ